MLGQQIILPVPRFKALQLRNRNILEADVIQPESSNRRIVKYSMDIGAHAVGFRADAAVFIADRGAVA